MVSTAGHHKAGSPTGLWRVVTALSILVCGLPGCTLVENFWNKEFVAVYAPSHLVERDKRQLAVSLDYFLGKSKEERIRVVGPPDQCTRLTTGEEVCEWTPQASSSEHHMLYTYDAHGIATSWSYHGAYGQFTNADYHNARVPSVSQASSDPQGAKGWSHSTKAQSELSGDYLACQNQALQDPRAGQRMAASVESAIEDCLRKQGWVLSSR